MTIHTPFSLIPESAPFSETERALLNDYFNRVFQLDKLAARGFQSAGSESSGDADDDDEPWRDPSLSLEERMTLAKDRQLPKRMMAAMGQQDCGQCGYNCKDYAGSIVQQAEPRLNLCVPGGKATARMLKALVEEMGGGALDPDEQAERPKPRRRSQRVAPWAARAIIQFSRGSFGLQKAQLARHPRKIYVSYRIRSRRNRARIRWRKFLPHVSWTMTPKLVEAILASCWRARPDFPIAGSLPSGRFCLEGNFPLTRARRALRSDLLHHRR